MKCLATASAATLFLMVAAAAAADAPFGDLPAGAISLSETRGVEAEICRDHLIAPADAQRTLPAGYRLLRADEAAPRQPALAALLQAQPQLAGHALGSLCFLSAREFSVDGVVLSPTPMPAAFWWARAEGPRHADMRGRAGWVQLGSWYPSGVTNRRAVLDTDPMAEFVDLEVAAVAPDRWRLRLVLPGETVNAEVELVGDRVPSRASQPGYLTVAMSGPAADRFVVYTYSGHHHREARGRWQPGGRGAFGRAFGIDGEAEVFGTVHQDGWVSRAALYRFAAPARSDAAPRQ